MTTIELAMAVAMVACAWAWQAAAHRQHWNLSVSLGVAFWTFAVLLLARVIWVWLQ